MIARFSDGVLMGATSSSWSVRQESIDRWREVRGRAQPFMLSAYKSEYARIDAMPITPIKGNPTNDKVLKQRDQYNAKTRAASAIEEQVLHNMKFNPAIMDGGERAFYLAQEQAAIDKGASAPTQGPGETSVNPLQEFVSAVTGGRTTTPTGATKTGIIEYLPYVGIGIGLFRVFFK